MADKTKKSHHSKHDKTKGAKKSKKEGPDPITKLENTLKAKNEELAKAEREIKEKDEAVESVIRLVYSRLPTETKKTKADEQQREKLGSKTIATLEEYQKEQVEKLQNWLAKLRETQAILQELRLATFADAKKNSKPVDLSRSQLSQTTLTSVDDSKVDWSAFDVNVDVKDISPPNWSAMPPIGKSSFAMVYRANYKGHAIVVKKLTTDKVDGKDLEQFKADFKLLTHVRGPPLLAHIGFNFDGPEKLVLLEEAKLGPLNRPGNIASLSFERRVKMTRGLTEALNLLHDRNPPVLHLRLTPANILLTSDYKIKVADYGRPFHLSNEQIMEGGYAPYLSPQRLAGETPSVEDDVYSYGICLAYLFTQELFLHHVKDFEQIKKLVTDGQRPPLKTEGVELPEPLEHFITMCFHANRAERPLLGNVLKREAPWDSWNQLMAVKLKGEAASIWDPRQGTSMKWNDLMAAWVSKFREAPKDEITIKCMKILMEVDLDKGDAEVHYEKFDKFLKWFGPINGTTVDRVLKFIPSLLKNETGSWFHGEIDDKTAKERLKLAGDSGYLVRLNPYDGKYSEPFLLSYRHNKSTSTVPFKLNFKSPAQGQVEEFVAKKKLNMKPSSKGRDTSSFDRAFKTGAAKGMGYSTAVNIGKLHMPDI